VACSATSSTVQKTPAAARGPDRASRRQPESRSFATVRGCPCPVAGRSLRPSMAFAHSMLTSLRHPACARQQRRLSGHGQPLTDTSGLHKSPTRKRGLATMGSGFPCSRCELGRAGDRRKLEELSSRKTRHPVVFAWPASAGWCCASHPAKPSPAVICHQRTLPHPHHRSRFSKAKNRCQSGKTQGRIPREDRNFRLSGPDR
jgi:hypothetical protein